MSGTDERWTCARNHSTPVGQDCGICAAIERGKAAKEAEKKAQQKKRGR